MNNNSRIGTGARTDREAADWLAYLYSGEATEEGKSRFSEWLEKSTAHAAAFHEMNQLWNDTIVGVEPELFGMGGDHKASVGIAFPQVYKSAYLANKWNRGIAVAAMLCLTFMGGVLLWLGLNQQGPVIMEYATQTGEIRTIKLEDGSAVTLSGSSTIKATFTQAVRNVKLVKGGAFFEVEHETGRPFIVDAEKTHVLVVGTKFEVNKAHNVVEIEVERGVVRVGAKLDHERVRNEVTLRAGQRVSADVMNGKIGTIEKFDPAHAAPWRFGMLVFRNARLDDVLAQVNRYRERKIVLADSGLADFPVTMALPTGKTDGLLYGLKATGAVDVEVIAGSIALKHR